MGIGGEEPAGRLGLGASRVRVGVVVGGDEAEAVLVQAAPDPGPPLPAKGRVGPGRAADHLRLIEERLLGEVALLERVDGAVRIDTSDGTHRQSSLLESYERPGRYCPE